MSQLQNRQHGSRRNYSPRPHKSKHKAANDDGACRASNGPTRPVSVTTGQMDVSTGIPHSVYTSLPEEAVQELPVQEEPNESLQKLEYEAYIQSGGEFGGRQKLLSRVKYKHRGLYYDDHAILKHHRPQWQPLSYVPPPSSLSKLVASSLSTDGTSNETTTTAPASDAATAASTPPFIQKWPASLETQETKPIESSVSYKPPYRVNDEGYITAEMTARTPTRFMAIPDKTPRKVTALDAHSRALMGYAAGQVMFDQHLELAKATRETCKEQEDDDDDDKLGRGGGSREYGKRFDYLLPRPTKPREAGVLPTYLDHANNFKFHDPKDMERNMEDPTGTYRPRLYGQEWHQMGCEHVGKSWRTWGHTDEHEHLTKYDNWAPEAFQNTKVLYWQEDAHGRPYHTTTPQPTLLRHAKPNRGVGLRWTTHLKHGTNQVKNVMSFAKQNVSNGDAVKTPPPPPPRRRKTAPSRKLQGALPDEEDEARQVLRQSRCELGQEPLELGVGG